MDSLSKTKCLWMYVFHYLEDRYRTITVYSKNIGQTIENKCKNGFVLHDWLTSFDFALGGEHQLLGCFSYATVWMSVHRESEWLCLLGECVEFHTLCAVQSVLGHRLIRFCSPFVNHADLVWVARWSTSAFLVLCLCVHMPDGWCVCVWREGSCHFVLAMYHRALAAASQHTLIRQAFQVDELMPDNNIVWLLEWRCNWLICQCVWGQASEGIQPLEYIHQRAHPPSLPPLPSCILLHSLYFLTSILLVILREAILELVETTQPRWRAGMDGVSGMCIGL